MLYLGTTPLAGMLKTKLFTSSGTFAVPSDVHAVWVDGCGAGGGGGGGNSTPGGGGGGGGPGYAIRAVLLSVPPGQSLTITIGAGGSGGSVNSDGGDGGGSTNIVYESVPYLSLRGGARGTAGSNPNGGNGGTLENGYGWVLGGAGAGTLLVYTPLSAKLYYLPAEAYQQGYCSGGSGGALNFNSAAAFGFSLQKIDPAYLTGAIGGSSGGAGGNGGMGPYGLGGAGGSNGAAGANATGYGCGGGGGSGNAAGGNGTSGFFRIYYISKYTVA